MMASAALVTTVLMVMLAADDPSARFSKQFNDGGSFGQAEGGTGNPRLNSANEWSATQLGHRLSKAHIDKVEDYPRITSLENHDPNSFWYTMRPNLFNIPVKDEWDFYNIIATDRPDFTDAPFTVGRQVTVIESGFTYRTAKEGEHEVSSRRVPEFLLRYGFNDHFEVRVRWNGYQMFDERDHSMNAREQYYGSPDMKLGFKFEIMQQKNWRPMVTVLGESFVPTGTRGLSADSLQPEINVVLGWGLKRWLYFKTSTGAAWVIGTEREFNPDILSPLGFRVSEHRDHETEWHQSASLLYQITDRFGGYSEWFCFFRNDSADNRADHFINTGIYIYCTPNIQFDFRIGQRVSNRIDEVFTGAGFSVRW